MKKICLILCLCIISLFFASCATNKEKVTMEKFENYASVYKTKIQSVNESIVINESTSATQNGEYIKVYSIETQDHICFSVRLTVISEKKAKLQVKFKNANEDWSVDNIALFAQLISKISNCELRIDEINAACEDICQIDNYRFNKNTSLYWDDYRYTLYYEEKFSIDMSQ